MYTDLLHVVQKIKCQFLGHVEFGVLSKVCRNYGICKIVPITDNCDSPLKEINVIVTVFNEEHVELDILKTAISKECYNIYFSREKFLVQEDFYFNCDEFSFKIKKGDYLIRKNRSLIKLIFS